MEEGVGSTWLGTWPNPHPLSPQHKGRVGSAYIPAASLKDTLLLCGPWSFPPHGHSSNILAYKFLTSKTWVENALHPGINENL